MRKVGWNRKKVRTLITHHMSGPSPTCEERNMSDSSEWGLLKTTAVVWEGWNPNAHKVPPKIYWNNPKIQVKSGDVIVTKAGPRDRVGVVVYVDSTPPNLMVSGKMVGLRPDNRLIDGRVLASILSSDESQRYLDARTTGMADSQLNFANELLLEMEVDVPPIEQHIYIGAIASLLRTQITKTKALIEKYQQIKAGLMHDLFTRGIGADGKLRPPREQAPELYQQNPIGWIPKDWGIEQISDLAVPVKGSTVIGPFGSDLVMNDYKSEGTPIIFVRDVREDKFNWVSNVFISSHKAERLFAHRVNGGDLLATKMGLPPCISCIYPDDMPMGVITADMIRMTVDTSKANPCWLSAAINHDRVKRQVAAITAGVTRAKVTLADFRSMKIAVPKPQEQLIANSILDKQRQLIAAEESSLNKLQKQKAGLIHDLLTGQVQVNVEQSEAALV